MKIAVVGGGPSGLYFAYLVKRHFPAFDVRVYEQTAADATYGFGVVLADGGLRQLKQVDAESAERIFEALHWNPLQRFVHRNEMVWLDKKRPGGAIERLRLLAILQQCCREAGVVCEFGRKIAALEDLPAADLVVGADGSHSVVRQSRAAEFGTQSRLLANRWAWYGADFAFETSCLNFREIPGGALVAHYYPYAAKRSTLVMECDEHTWFATGMDRMSDDERQRYTEQFYQEELQGRPLINNKSNWRQFEFVTNREWHAGHCVLIGDALRTAHFSIGSGTRLALEDAIALFQALQRSPGNVPALLEDFVATRKPAREKLSTAAEKSFTWYDGFRLKMQQHDVVGLAHDFVMRTGRITPERFESEFPSLVARLRERQAPGTLAAAS